MKWTLTECENRPIWTTRGCGHRPIWTLIWSEHGPVWTVTGYLLHVTITYSLYLCACCICSSAHYSLESYGAVAQPMGRRGLQKSCKRMSLYLQTKSINKAKTWLTGPEHIIKEHVKYSEICVKLLHFTSYFTLQREVRVLAENCQQVDNSVPVGRLFVQIFWHYRFSPRKLQIRVGPT